jgi:hypothetical protein
VERKLKMKLFLKNYGTEFILGMHLPLFIELIRVTVKPKRGEASGSAVLCLFAFGVIVQPFFCKKIKKS